MRTGTRSVLLCLLMIAGACRQEMQEGALQTKADSLVQLTMALQEKLGSPDIQRMHDFENEILADLERFPEQEDDAILMAYRDLREGLDRCMQACSQFHAEAFLLEANLREIMEQAHQEGADLDSLTARLAFEQQVYEDLSHRVDSSFESAMEQAKRFYELKPMVEQLDSLQ